MKKFKIVSLNIVAPVGVAIDRGDEEQVEGNRWSRQPLPRAGEVLVAKL